MRLITGFRAGRAYIPPGSHSPARGNRAQETMTKTIEEREREFTEAVQAFIDTAIAGGHSLEGAKAIARDVVARAIRKRFRVVSSR